MEFYKGYMISKNKMPIDKFTNKKNLKTLDQILEYNPDEYVGILSDETVMIDFDNEEMSKIALEIIKENELNCRVIKTTRGIHCLFRKDDYFNYANTNKQLANGLIADIKLGVKNGIEVLRYNNIDREVIYDKETIDTPPCYFRPLKYNASNNVNFLGMGKGDGRNDLLFRHIINLMKLMRKEDAITTLHMINDKLFKDKLDEKEMRNLTRDSAFDEVKTENFFNDKGQFLFDVFANYLMRSGKIIKINNQLHVYKDGIYINGMDWVEREMIKNIPNLSQSKRKEVFSYLKLLIEQNSNPTEYNHLIAFKNGVYNIFSNEFVKFSEDYIITNKINWNYNENAYSAIVDDLLNKLSCNDVNIRKVLEEMIGYCFFRQNELGKAFILVGPQANGKSTIQALLQKLFGSENISSIDLKDLGERFKTAELYGKLANIGDDIGDNYIDDSNMFKTIVTGGRVIAEKKGQDPFEFEPYVKCIYSANNIPKMRDRTGAIKRRLVIIPFDRQFSPTDADFDPYIKYKLINGYGEYSVDENMSYLINLGIAGLKRVLENNGFTKSDKIDEKLNEYDKDNNPIKIWFEELGDAATEIEMSNTQDVYNKYVDFCNGNKLRVMSKIEFSKAVKHEFGFTIKNATVNGKSIRIYVRDYK